MTLKSNKQFRNKKKLDIAFSFMLAIGCLAVTFNVERNLYFYAYIFIFISSSLFTIYHYIKYRSHFNNHLLFKFENGKIKDCITQTQFNFKNIQVAHYYPKYKALVLEFSSYERLDSSNIFVNLFGKPTGLFKKLYFYDKKIQGSTEDLYEFLKNKIKIAVNDNDDGIRVILTHRP